MAPYKYRGALNVDFNCPSQLYTSTTGGVNVIAAVVSIYYVDKLGMRLSFLEGGVQMLFCQLAKHIEIHKNN
ncbi:hypothetical protein KY285_023952 [Solanum tuberosum]|nr:hypothetical protein KY289_024299 [Solanum tuberosum]KAH0676151.1 hypothetical protein KY285_023952 [Solanum tuberosum]